MLVEEKLTYQIRGAIFEVFNELGPGLLESIYRNALLQELNSKGLKVLSEVYLPVIYKSQKLALNYRIDLLIEDKVIIEIKSVEQVQKVHHKQLLTYLKLANKPLGILVNFNTDSIGSQIFRKINS